MFYDILIFLKPCKITQNDLKPTLVEHLVCPICRKNFNIKITKKSKEEIMQGYLFCSNKHKFKIIDGIPRFVTDLTKDFVKTEDAFSSKWKIYHKSYHEKKWFEF